MKASIHDPSGSCPEGRLRDVIWLLVVASVFGLVLLLSSSIVRAPRSDLQPTWTDRFSGIQFVLVRPGTFRMGTPPEEADRETQEVLHTVTLSRPFYLGRFEVTQAEWSHVMGRNPSHFQDCGPSCPVETVSWFEVGELIARLNTLSQPGFRLPTEAEWEYACRAGGTMPFGHSSALSSRDANINGKYPYNAPEGVVRGRPTAVGHFGANPLGFFDMAGNVWEWTADEHCPYENGPATDPVGRCGGALRVIRGGSWLFDGASARCGLRYTHRPQDRGYSLGVRLAHDTW